MVEPFRNLLVPVDNSSQSKIAQEMAIFLCKTLHSRATLMHVVPDELPALAGEIYSPTEDYVPINPATYQFPRTIGLPRPKANVLPDEIINEMTQRLRDNGETLLMERTSVFKTEGIDVTQKLVDSKDAAEAIIEQAEVNKHDLIVIGNGGEQKDESDMSLGSITRRVIVNAKTSVMVVRRKRELTKILLPLDGSPREYGAIQEAQMLSKATGAKIVLLHVQEKPLLSLKPENREIESQILNGAAKQLAGATVELKLGSGDPAKMIIRTAEQNDVDLIVMRAGEMGALKRVFLGSVSDHVIHYATVPILLAR